MRRAGELPGRKARAHQNHRRAWGYRPAQQSDDQDALSFGLGWLEAGRTAAPSAELEGLSLPFPIFQQDAG